MPWQEEAAEWRPTSLGLFLGTLYLQTLVPPKKVAISVNLVFYEPWPIVVCFPLAGVRALKTKRVEAAAAITAAAAAVSVEEQPRIQTWRDSKTRFERRSPSPLFVPLASSSRMQDRQKY